MKSKIKQLNDLAESIFPIAHKLAYAYEIKDEDEASKLIETVLSDCTKVLK
jgi:hypothetical protein